MKLKHKGKNSKGSSNRSVTYEDARRRLDEHLVVDLYPDAALLLGNRSRSATYKAAREGEIPVLRIGKLCKVTCANLKKMLGLAA